MLATMSWYEVASGCFDRTRRSRVIAMMSGSSIVASTCGWLDRICSIRVEPARGMPTTHTGDASSWPAPLRPAKNSRV